MDEIEQTGNDVKTEITKNVGPIAGTALGGFGGPIIGAAGSIAGGLISNLFNKGQQQKAENFQRELAQHGISWRVADAKAAGIHPLFALGAQIPMANPMVLGDSLGQSIAQAGQYVGNAMSQQMTEAERMAQWANYRVATSTAERNEAEAGYFNTLAGNLQREQIASPLGPHQEGKGQPMAGQQPNVPGGPLGAPGTEEGWYNLKAVDQPSRKPGIPGVQAGRYDGYQLVILPGGLPLLMPALEGESWQEHWSEMAYPEKAGIMFFNQNVFGKGWARQFMNFKYGGVIPNDTKGYNEKLPKLIEKGVRPYERKERR